MFGFPDGVSSTIALSNTSEGIDESWQTTRDPCEISRQRQKRALVRVRGQAEECGCVAKDHKLFSCGVTRLYDGYSSCVDVASTSAEEKTRRLRAFLRFQIASNRLKESSSNCYCY